MDSQARVIEGHVLDVLAGLPAESVSCVVTSPPYWSLRKYDAPDVTWPGNDPDCPHTLEAAPPPKRDRQHLAELGERDGSHGGKKHSTGEQYGVAGGYSGKARWQHEGVSRQETPEAWVKETVEDRHYDFGTSTLSGSNANQMAASAFKAEVATCSRCGAWKGSYGLEPIPDCLAWARGEPPCSVCYVCHTRTIWAALWRVMREDSVMWWDIGDSYAAMNRSGRKESPGVGAKQEMDRIPMAVKWEAGGGSNFSWELPGAIKQKDLILMPERIALAAQADGWWVRSRIIWHKPNAMPESVKDRCTDDHEHIWMLTKSARYWSDFDAVREPSTSPEQEAHNQRYAKSYPAFDDRAEWSGVPGNINNVGIHSRPGPGGRNLRTVWSFPTAQNADAFKAPNVLPDGSVGKASPDCPVHGQLAEAANAPSECADGLPDRGAFDSADSGGDLVLAPASEPDANSMHDDHRREQDHSGDTPSSVPRDRRPDPLPSDESNQGGGGQPQPRTSHSEGAAKPKGDRPDSPALEDSQTATPRNRRSRRMGPAPSTTPSCTPSGGTPDHTGGTLELPASASPRLDRGESSTSAGSESHDPAGQSPDRKPGTCTCPSHYSIGHFATFPLALPLRCIQASCPREVCTACGKARVRIVQKAQPPSDMRNRETATILALAEKGRTRVGGGQKLQDWYEENPPNTVGWSDCGCPGGDGRYQPGLVLDPFAGVGTTGVAALRLGRRFIGIELSEQYAQMAREKLRFWWRDTRLVPPEPDAAQAVLPLEGGD